MPNLFHERSCLAAASVVLELFIKLALAEPVVAVIIVPVPGVVFETEIKVTVSHINSRFPASVRSVHF